jgi:TrmH family RNA methyltransferase
MTDRLITSTTNPLIKRLRALEQRKNREKQGEFFVEGIRPVWQAAESKAELRVLIVAPEILKSEAAQEMVERQARDGVQVAQVSRRIFETIASRENPSGLGAIVSVTSRGLDDLVVTPDSLFVALEGVANPGNLGAIIRTMDAVAASGLILVGKTTDPFHPAAVKASMGTIFTIPVAHAQNVDQLHAWSQSHQVRTITTSPSAEAIYWSVVYPFPAVMFFGSEGEGLSAQVLQEGDLSVRIPMLGRADSLNLAVAAGVLLYQARRQQLSMLGNFTTRVREKTGAGQ